MSVKKVVPRTTHTWLKPLYDYLDHGVVAYQGLQSGFSGIFSGVWLGSNVPVTMVGQSTGVVGFYGSTGLPQIGTVANGVGLTGGTNYWSGSSGILATGIGGSGLLSAINQLGWNGGSGTIYDLNDVVRQLKNMGVLPA